MRMGPLEVVIVLAVIVLFLLPKQLPKLTESINNSVNSFKKNKSEVESAEKAEAADN